MSEAVSPVIAQPILDQTLNEGSAFSLDLRDYIKNLYPQDGDIVFTVSLLNGESLPSGLGYTREGVISGIPAVGVAQQQPYELLIIAKNKADVPLIAEMNIWISSAHGVGSALAAAEAGTDQLVKQKDVGDRITEGSLPDALTDDFWFDFAQKEEGHFFIESDIWSQALNDRDYRKRFLEHLLRKFSSLQIYNADYVASAEPEHHSFERSTVGWPIYIDGHFALATSNPDPFASYLNRGAFVQTVREMVLKAAECGWKTVGIAGFDKRIGWQLLREYNDQQKRNPSHERRILECDDIFQDREWVDQLFTSTTPTQQVRGGDSI